MTVTSIVVPPEKHIPVELAEISTLLKSTLLLDKDAYNEVAKLLESLCTYESGELRRRLRQGFRHFSAGARKQALVVRKDKPPPAEEQLKHSEQRFLSDLDQLLTACHFEALKKHEWDTALEENFKVNMPLAVDWKVFDKRLLAAFWQDSPERKKLLADLPDISDKVLVYHRGIGIAKDSGLFLREKVELLVQYIITGPAIRLLERLRKQKGVEPAADKQPARAERQESQHKHVQSVERRTLARVLPSVVSVIRALPRQVQIEEPTFKDVVLVYRLALSGKEAKAQPRGQQDTLRKILSARNIHVKRFSDVPMADMEVVFPSKTVYISRLSMIQLGVMFAIAVLGFIFTLFSQGINKGLLFSGLSVVVARAVSVYSSIQLEKAQLSEAMGTMVYNKMEDSQEGVLASLMDELSDQALKEMLLAYFVLQASTTALTKQQLDDAIEDFLALHFGVKMDFVLDSALQRLLAWHLVYREGEDQGMTPAGGEAKYAAVGMPEAREHLEQAWVNIYRAAPAGQDEPIQFGSGMGVGKVFKGIGSMATTLRASIKFGHGASLPQAPAGNGYRQSGFIPASRPTTRASMSQVNGAASDLNGISVSSRGPMRHTVDDVSSIGGSDVTTRSKKHGMFSGLFKRKKDKDRRISAGSVGSSVR